MKHFYFSAKINFILVTLLSSFVFAQKPMDNSQFELIPDQGEQSITVNGMRIMEPSGVPVAIYNPNYPVTPGTNEDMARQYLTENSQLLKIKEDLSDLHFLTTKETPAAYHVHFQQYKGEFPVANSTINVTISKNNKVVFVMNGYKIQYGNKSNPDLTTINFTKDAALNSAKTYLGIQGSIVYEKSETEVYYNNGTFRLAQVATVIPAEENFGQWEVMVDAQTGEIFRVANKACNLKEGNKDPQLVNGTGYVFDPDPITHARTTYGSTGFVDNNDADSDSLTAHREFRTLNDITFNGSVYSLVGPYAEIRDFEAPFTGLAYKSDK